MSIYDQFSPQELDILRKRAERVARPIEDRQIDDAISALIVLVGTESYAIPTHTITGVYENLTTVPVPCTPAFVAGIANIRGHIIPVLDLGAFLNIVNQKPATNTLVVVSYEDLSVAILVTETGSTETVSAASFLPVPESANLAQRGHIKGLLADGTALLNIESILSESTQHINEGSY